MPDTFPPLDLARQKEACSDQNNQIVLRAEIKITDRVAFRARDFARRRVAMDGRRKTSGGVSGGARHPGELFHSAGVGATRYLVHRGSAAVRGDGGPWRVFAQDGGDGEVSQTTSLPA